MTGTALDNGGRLQSSHSTCDTFLILDIPKETKLELIKSVGDFVARGTSADHSRRWLAELLFRDLREAIDNDKPPRRHNRPDLQAEWSNAPPPRGSSKKHGASLDSVLDKSLRAVANLLSEYGSSASAVLPAGIARGKCIVEKTAFDWEISGPLSRHRGDGVGGDIYLLLTFQPARVKPLGSFDAADQWLEPQRETSDVFRKALKAFDPRSGPAVQAQTLDALLDAAWDALSSDPTLMPADEELYPGSPLLDVLRPIAALTSGRDVDASALICLFQSLKFVEDYLGTATIATTTTRTRTILTLAYQYRDLLATSQVLNFLNNAIERREPFWMRFATDLHLREIVGYVRLPSSFGACLATASIEYRALSPRSALAQLWPYVTDPIAATTNREDADVVASLHNIARTCADERECRWAITAMQRVSLLFDHDEEDEADSSYVLDVIDTLPKTISSKSSLIETLALQSLLRRFFSTRRIEFLIEYEKRFIARSNVLREVSILDLQAEYAACVAIATIFVPEEAHSLRCYELFEKGEALTAPLFRNRFADSMDTPPSHPPKGVTSWCDDYAVRLLSAHAYRRIDQNPSQALAFRAPASLFRARGLLTAAVKRGLPLLEAFVSEGTPNDCARTCELFRLIDLKEHKTLAALLAANGTHADRYTLTRYSRHVFYILSRHYTFGGIADDQKQLLMDAANAAFAQLDPSKPSLAWLYYGAIRYHESDAERAFVGEFLAGIPETPRLEKNVDRAAFNLSLLPVVKKHIATSYLAAGVNAAPESPVAWNALATAITDIQQDDALTLSRSAYLYHWSRWLATSQKRFAQKYAFNYIRAQALALRDEAEPEIGFLFEGARYLARSEAFYFFYKRECAAPFISLVERWWLLLPQETTESLSRTLLSIDWLKRMVSWLRARPDAKPGS